MRNAGKNQIPVSLHNILTEATMNHFLKKVALGAIVCAFAACSSLPKDWSGMSTEAISQWEQNGFNAEQAQIWKAAGFAPAEASGWKKATLDAKTAQKWKAQSFTSEEAVGWIKKEMDLDEAVDHRAKGLQPIGMQATEAPEAEEASDDMTEESAE